jgi:hypothetical protein
MRIHQASLAVILSTAVALPSVAIAAPPPSSPAGDPSGMSDEEKLENAKTLYGEGDAALQSGDPATALQKFEEAYNTYAPSMHLFNFNIASAAYELGDCAKAKVAYQRFLDLVPDHPARGDAQEKLLEIERSGCASAVPDPGPAVAETPTTTGPVFADNEDAPELTSKRSAREDKIDDEIDEKESKRASPMLLSGAIMTAVGGAALIGGAVSAGIASKHANDLAGLASPGPTGFPDGNYSDDKVFDTDRNKLPSANKAMVALLVAGGVLTAVGVTLIVLDVKKKKKKKRPGDKNAGVRPRPHMAGFGPGLIPGGAGAAATVRF